jgi:hypothetical protein
MTVESKDEATVREDGPDVVAVYIGSLHVASGDSVPMNALRFCLNRWVQSKVDAVLERAAKVASRPYVLKDQRVNAILALKGKGVS